MNIKSRRIRMLLKGGQWSFWMNADEFRRYRDKNENIREVVIEETVSYDDAMKYIGAVK